MDQSQQSQLDLEIELIESSLLPSESLANTSTKPNIIDITSTASKLALHITINDAYPAPGSIGVEVKGPEVGREEAEGWRVWVEARLKEWDSDEDYPLFQILTTHFLPLLAPSSPTHTASPSHAANNTDSSSTKPHHALLTSHHLLANSKRKDLHSLSSSLSLIGFSKTGHPGIMYAIGTREDLEEWIREVKSWQWLALRVRMTAEPIEGEEEVEIEKTKGSESGARGGKGRGEWVEVEKISEALEWLRGRGREGLLLDIGMGGGSGGTDK